jgi:hypothetical protein
VRGEGREPREGEGSEEEEEVEEEEGSKRESLEIEESHEARSEGGVGSLHTPACGYCLHNNFRNKTLPSPPRPPAGHVYISYKFEK